MATRSPAPSLPGRTLLQENRASKPCRGARYCVSWNTSGNYLWPVVDCTVVSAALQARVTKWLVVGRIVLSSLGHEGLGFLTLWPRVKRNVPGWLTGPDAHLLYSLAHHGPGTGAIVEIGSAWGMSTVFLASGSKHSRRERVIAIDPHTGDPWYLQGIAPTRSGIVMSGAQGKCEQETPFSSLQQFEATLLEFGVDDWVDSAVMTSEAAAEQIETGPIRLLFVDGLHTYEGVSLDIDSWVPRVIKDGVIVFDDYFNRNPGVGVKRAVDELLTSGLVEPTLHHEGGYFTWTRKT